MKWTRIALSVIVLIVLAPAVVNAHARGESPEHLNVYNLGPLGGEVKIVEKPDSRSKTGLEVTALKEGAPAQLGGLKVGDIILGAPRPFGEHAYDELGAEIADAESARKGKLNDLDLIVLREGDKTTIELGVQAYGSDAKKFPEGDMGEALIADALAFMADEQGNDGAWDTRNTVSDVVYTSLCGLAFMAAGHTPETGKYKPNVDRAVEFVMEKVGQRSGAPAPAKGNGNMTNWSLSYGALFLAEVHRAAPRPGLEEKLTWIRDELERNMEESGGFAHGPGGPCSKGYTEFAIATSSSMRALGVIQGCGIEIDQQKIEKMKEYLQRCAEGNSGIGYAHQVEGYRWPACVGRTSSAIMAYAALGDEKDSFCRKMIKYYGKNYENVLDVHVSASMHYLNTACVAWKLGKRDWSEWWEAYRPHFTMARNADGTFTGRPTDDSRKLGVCTDIDNGPVWCTAHWAIIMSLPQENLPVMFNERGGPENPAEDE